MKFGYIPGTGLKYYDYADSLDITTVVSASATGVDSLGIATGSARIMTADTVTITLDIDEGLEGAYWLVIGY